MLLTRLDTQNDRVRSALMDAPLYEFIYRHTEFVTQLPFELKLTMPEPNRGRRGYSDEYVAKVREELV